MEKCIGKYFVVHTAKTTATSTGSTQCHGWVKGWEKSVELPHARWFGINENLVGFASIYLWTVTMEKLFNFEFFFVRFSISDFDISKDFRHRIAFFTRLAGMFFISSAIDMTRHILNRNASNWVSRNRKIYSFEIVRNPFFVKVTFAS